GAGRIHHRPLGRKFELARPHLVSRQLPAGGIAAKISSLLRGRFQSGVPHEFQNRVRSLAGSCGNFPAVDSYFSSRFKRASARGWRYPAFSERPALARPHPFLRMLSWRRWLGDWRQPSNRLDRPGRKADRTEWRITHQNAGVYGRSQIYLSATKERAVSEQTEIQFGRAICGDLAAAESCQGLVA